MKRLSAFVIHCVLILVSISVFASPTSHDFKKCEKLAVSYLDYCLKGDKKDCWGKSQKSHDACRLQVIQSYQDMTPKRKAEEARSKLFEQAF